MQQIFENWENIRTEDWPSRLVVGIIHPVPIFKSCVGSSEMVKWHLRESAFVRDNSVSNIKVITDVYE